MAVALHAAANHGTVEHVERGEQVVVPRRLWSFVMVWQRPA
jgi:hypothetical protein